MESVDEIDYLREAEAPGRLELVRRFANTLDLEHGREALHSPERLRSLLLELGLLDRGARVTRADLERAHALRDTLRELALANNGVPTDAALDAALVGIVYTAIADGTWPRLKACRRDVCRWLFYDRSRNRSAVWCQMSVCGNRTKTSTYRARLRRA